jgi:hypothetical protein
MNRMIFFSCPKHFSILQSLQVKFTVNLASNCELFLSSWCRTATAPLPHYSSFIASVQPLGSSSQQEGNLGTDATTNGYFNSGIELEDVTQN